MGLLSRMCFTWSYSKQQKFECLASRRLNLTLNGLYFKRVAHESKETDNPVALYSTKTRPAHRELHALLFAIGFFFQLYQYFEDYCIQHNIKSS